MELSISTPKGAKGTVEVSELAFGKEFNQDLVHQAVVAYQASAVALSLGLKKVVVAHVRVLHVVRSGVVVVLHSLLSRVTTSKRLIEKCIVLQCVASCLSWLVKIA